MFDEPDSKVTYLGESKIGESLLIKPPDGLLDSSPAKGGDTIDWSVDCQTGVVLVSNGKLSQPRYAHVAKRAWAGKAESYRFSVPSQLLAETYHAGGEITQELFPRQGKLERGESLHFVSAEVMRNEHGRACFALTEDECTDNFDLGDLLDPWK